jgi:hypothetical protein
MKSLLIISPHSFVDVITNSSTELFVCDTTKTLDAVKEVLAKLLQLHNELTDEENTFESVFKELCVTPYEFDFYKVPKEIRDEYEQFCRYGNPFVKTHYFFDEDDKKNEEREILEEKERELRKGLEYKEFLKERDALWTDYGIKAFDSAVKLFVEFLKQNSFTAEEINEFLAIAEATKKSHKEQKGGEHVWLRIDSIADPADPRVMNAWDTFTLWEGYGITAKKGSIMVEGASDNSIPYLLMDSISSYLHADRYHLG